MNESSQHPPFSMLIRLAVLIAVAALGCMLVFLGQAFSPWTLGVGVIFGIPLLVVGMGLYLFQVVRELRRKGAL